MVSKGLTLFRRLGPRPFAGSRGAFAAACFGLIVVIGLALSVDAMAASRPGPGSYLIKTKSQLRLLRKELFGALDADQRSLERKIDYDVRPNWRVAAYASHQGGYRDVVLYGGVLAIMEFLTDAMLLERHYAAPGCVQAYMKAIVAVDKDNRKRIVTGHLPKRIPSVFEFAEQAAGACKVMAIDSFYGNPTVVAERRALLKGGVAYLLSHEVAHHILGHVDRWQAADFVDFLEKRRAAESAADDWAFSRMAEIGLNPIQAFAVMMYAAATNRFTADEERRSTHPSGAKRFRVMLKRARAMSARGTPFRQALERRGELAEWNRRLKEIEISFNKLLVAKL